MKQRISRDSLAQGGVARGAPKGPTHRSKNPIEIKNKRQTQEKLLGGGKVGIQNQDSHFSTAPIACGARKRNCRLHKTLDAPRLRPVGERRCQRLTRVDAPCRLCRLRPRSAAGRHRRATPTARVAERLALTSAMR